MKRLPFRSLMAQFVGLHILVAIGAGMILLASASALLHHAADHFQRASLRRQAALSIANATESEAGARTVVLSSGMAVGLIGPDRRLRRTDGPRRPAILAAAPLDRRPRFFRRGAVEGYSLPFRDGWVVVSQDDADPAVVTDDIVRAFLMRFALIGMPIAAVAPLVGVLIARRMMLRMRAVSAIAATIGPRAPDVRLPLDDLPLEAEPLARATNAALDRLAAALHVQAAFAADVAHELRTPLAAIRLRADAIPDPALRAPVMQAVDRAARVIAQLLALAELERPLHEGAVAIDLHALAEQVVADRAPAIIAGGRSIALDRQGEEARAIAYPDALALALNNLIDNAAQHTAPGTEICVAAGPGGRLVVSDNGAPIPEGDLSRLTDRLWRGAGADAQGSGIGLSIVERVAHAHGTRLVIAHGSGGRGLRVAITL